MNARDYELQAEYVDYLESALKTNPPKQHPMMKFIELDGTPTPPNWVIEGFVEEGLVSIAGQQGSGKTTAIFPLSCIVAGLVESDLSPGQCWRHCIYCAEHTEQVQRIAAGLTRAGLIDPAKLAERIHVSQAVRMPSGDLVAAGAVILAEYTRFVDGIEIKPLVILDTKSACLDSDDENSNSETSRTVADLKQRFAGLPIWLVGHVSKANFGRSDVESMSSRGASALEGDCNQTMFLVRDGEQRWLVNGKVRFEAKHRELLIDSHIETLGVKNRFGQDEVLALRYGIPITPDVPRSEVAKARKDEAKEQAHGELRQQVLEALRAAQARGDRLNASRLRETLGRKVSAVLQVITELLNEQWVAEVFIPASIRTHPKRDTFLFALTTEQHDQVTMDGCPMPPESSEIPPTWRKADSGTIGNS